MKKVYEVWQETSTALATTLTTAARAADSRSKGLIAPDAQLLYSFEASSFEEANAIFHLRMGFEPYKPGGEPAPCPNCGAMYWPEGSGECWKCDYGA